MEANHTCRLNQAGTRSGCRRGIIFWGADGRGVTNMDAPQITTIIPTFRREKQLRQTLLSVVNQSGIGIEVIVVDDSPEASARQVVDDFKDQRIQYLHNACPSGGFPSRVR